MSPDVLWVSGVLGGFALYLVALTWWRLGRGKHKPCEAAEPRAPAADASSGARSSPARSVDSAALAAYISAVDEKLATLIRHIEQARIDSEPYYYDAAIEAECTRLVDRSARFVGYCESLIRTNAAVGSIAEQLSYDRRLIATVLDCLRSGRWETLPGRPELEEMYNVMNKVKRERARDRAEEHYIQRRKADMQKVQAFKEKMIEVEERLREQERRP